MHSIIPLLERAGSANTRNYQQLKEQEGPGARYGADIIKKVQR